MRLSIWLFLRLIVKIRRWNVQTCRWNVKTRRRNVKTRQRNLKTCRKWPYGRKWQKSTQKCQKLPRKWLFLPDRLIFYTVHICWKFFPRFLYYYFINNWIQFRNLFSCNSSFLLHFVLHYKLQSFKIQWENIKVNCNVMFRTKMKIMRLERISIT